MRTLVLAAALIGLVVPTSAQCPDYSNGVASAGIGKFNGGDEARLVYVDCLQSIAFIEAKFGRPGLTVPLNGLPLTLAVYDDPNDDMDPSDAVFVASISVPGGVTGGHTDLWQRYDLFALASYTIPATGGMFVAVGVTYPAGAGPASIQFGNNAYPRTQWLVSDRSGTLDYTNLSTNRLLDLSTGPGFPPGAWIVRVEGGAAYRPFGAGCAGSNGTPSLAGVPSAPPILGQALLLSVANLPNPATPTALALGVARFQTPLDLGTIGMPGCRFYVNLIGTEALVSSGGASGWATVVPVVQSLAGVSLFLQVTTVDAGANQLGVTTSNALQAVIGR